MRSLLFSCISKDNHAATEKMFRVSLENPVYRNNDLFVLMTLKRGTNEEIEPVHCCV